MTESFYCKKLPNIIKFEGDWFEYDKLLYSIFVKDFIYSQALFKGKRVAARKDPKVNGRREGFYHLTHEDFYKTGFEHRIPDIRRCERLVWIRPIIENYGCVEDCCTHIKVWRNKDKVKLLFYELSYLIVLQDRKSHYAIITAFRIKYRHYLDNQIEEYEKLKENPI